MLLLSSLKHDSRVAGRPVVKYLEMRSKKMIDVPVVRYVLLFVMATRSMKSSMLIIFFLQEYVYQILAQTSLDERENSEMTKRQTYRVRLNK